MSEKKINELVNIIFSSKTIEEAQARTSALLEANAEAAGIKISK